MYFLRNLLCVCAVLCRTVNATACYLLVVGKHICFAIPSFAIPIKLP